MSYALCDPLRLIFVDGSQPVLMVPAIQQITLPQFAAGHLPVIAYNSDGTPHDLTGDTVLLGVRLHPTDASPAISLQLTSEYGDEDHEGRFELIPGHWVDVPPRVYAYNVVALLAGDPDDRAVVLPSSRWKTTAESVHPGDDVQVPDAQQPLAQGPQGEQGAQGPTGPQGEPGADADTGDWAFTDGAADLATPGGMTIGASVAEFGAIGKSGTGSLSWFDGGAQVLAPNGDGLLVQDDLAQLSADGGTGRIQVKPGEILTQGVVKVDASIEVPTIGTASDAQHALPSGTGALVSVDATQTLTGKTISGGAVEHAAAHGTLRLEANQQGADAEHNNWFKYTPAEAAAAAWYAWFDEFTNASGTRKNQTWGFGYNYAGGGNRVDPAEPALAFSFEAHYNPSGTPVMEPHLLYVRANGSQSRLFTGSINKSTDVTQFNILSDTGRIGPAHHLLFGASAVQLNSENFNASVNVDNNEASHTVGSVRFVTNAAWNYSLGHMVAHSPGTWDLGRSGQEWRRIRADWSSSRWGAELTAAATITPTTSLHTVAGATTIDTIATTNVVDGDRLTLVRNDASNTTTVSAAGNVAVAFTITTNGQGKTLVYNATTTKWHPVN